MIKTTGAHIGVVVAIALVLAGCGGTTTSPSTGPSISPSTATSSGPSTSPSTGEPGVITFSGQTQEQELWDGLFQAFEAANPGYTVDATYSPNDSYPQLVQTQLQAGQAADVIQSTPGTGGGLAALTLAAGGRLATLTDTAWAPSLPEVAKPLVTLDGEVYAYPTDLAPFFVAYNPDLFEDAGVEVPTTFDELLGACTTLADAGLIPIALAGASFQNMSITIQTLAANNVFGPVPDWNEKRRAGQTTFADTPEWQKVLSDFQRMIDARCYAVDVAGVQAPVHSQQFASAQAAMYVMPAQAIAIVRNNVAEGTTLNVSSFAFPADTAEQTRVPVNSGISLVVNAEARDVDAAKKLLEFLSTPEQRIAYAERAGTIAPAAGPDGSDVMSEELEPLRPFLESEMSVTLNYLFWPNAGVAQQLATSAQGLLTGQKTVDQVLADTDQAWDTAN